MIDKMKIQESGMPEEHVWSTFFDTQMIFDKLELNEAVHDLVEIGFGYGTFTIPAGQLISGRLFAFDIEDHFVKSVQEKIDSPNSSNINLQKKDVIEQGTDLQDNSVDYVMLFNILHGESSGAIIEEAYHILKPGGKVGIIHWIYDADTPRGPSMDIRLKPVQLKLLLQCFGFAIHKFNISLPPYHYGILGVK